MKRIFTVILILLTVCVSADARKVKGEVRSGDTPLEGVIVTDGYGFTKTGRTGRFALELDERSEFVYIVTPAGFVADWSSGVPRFYIPVTGRNRFDFDLQVTSGNNCTHIVAVSDPQTHSDAQFAEFAGAPLADIALTGESLEGDVVGLALGDISWDRIEILDMYKEKITSAGFPFYPVVGNHDNEAYVEGDDEASASYRKKMGPENYAFCLGDDVVMVLDNIIYDTNFKCRIGYTDEVVEWVRGLMALLPSDAGLFVAQHSPLGHGERKTVNEDALLELLEGRNVNFLSGHTHVNGNRIISPDIYEHNVAAICGAWWDTDHCIDGTPRGYKVLSKRDGLLTWYYKPVGYGPEHMAEVFAPGQVQSHPESVVVNVWDWDPLWKVQWYEDGVYMGEMERVRAISPVFASEIEAAYAAYGTEIPRWKKARPAGHNFAVTPSPEAASVTVVVESRFGRKWTRTINLYQCLE